MIKIEGRLQYVYIFALPIFIQKKFLQQVALGRKTLRGPFGRRGLLCILTEKNIDYFGYNVKIRYGVLFSVLEGNKTSEQLRLEPPPPP